MLYQGASGGWGIFEGWCGGKLVRPVLYIPYTHHQNRCGGVGVSSNNIGNMFRKIHLNWNTENSLYRFSCVSYPCISAQMYQNAHFAQSNAIAM